MSATYMTLAEIYAAYPMEHVFLERYNVSRHGEIVGGYLIVYSADRDEFDRLLYEYKPTGGAIFFTGPTFVTDDPDEVFIPHLDGWPNYLEDAMDPNYMTVAEIYAAYPNEWVVIDRPKKDRRSGLLGGYVVAHGADDGTIDAAIASLPRPFKIAVRYTGPLLDPNTEYML